MADFPLGGTGSEYKSIGVVNSSGTSVASSSTVNTKGAFVELTASMPDSQCVTIALGGVTVSGGADFLLDIAVGGVGSEEVIIPNILFSYQANFAVDWFKKLSFPISIQSGLRVSARVQSTVSSQSVNVGLEYGVPTFFEQQLPSEVVAFGDNTADSGGTIVDTSGSNNTKGSWVEFSASTPEEISGLMLLTGVAGNTSQRSQSRLHDIGMGSAGNEEVIISDIFATVTTDETTFGMTGFKSISIPQGSRLAIRTQSSDASNANDRQIDFILYGAI